MKNFKGKAIYNPSGKAGEYSYWACNFYIGCSNCCEYCFLKKGIGKATLGGSKPTLKKCFKNEYEALNIFEKELNENRSDLQKYGLFFSFTTDPMLEGTINLTYQSIRLCLDNHIPVKILTKRADWIDGYVIKNGNKFIDFPNNIQHQYRNLIAFGFTLTGHDELEQNASTNIDRISAMIELHKAGFRTWVSIEPVVDIPSSVAMINLSHGFCDLYNIGLESGKRYSKKDLIAFVEMVNKMYSDCRIYFKDTLLKKAGIERSELPSNCVCRNYNIF